MDVAITNIKWEAIESREMYLLFCAHGAKKDYEQARPVDKKKIKNELLFGSRLCSNHNVLFRANIVMTWGIVL